MRILVAHTRYQQRGGEDEVVDAEIRLLRDRGHEVLLHEEHNDSIDDMSRVRVAMDTIWSRRSANKFAALAETFAPDIVHCHNTFPLISPSVYWKAGAIGVPIVQTLHNYRLICPQAMLLRNGKICEECVGRLPWRGVLHRCYRDSAAQSAVISAMLSIHRSLGTYTSKVHGYIALTEFARSKLCQGGLPADRFFVKPNFVDIARPEPVTRQRPVYVGRLSPEKGLGVLTEALDGIAGFEMKIIGSGPMFEALSKKTYFQMTGRLDNPKVRDELTRSTYLVFPSIWYEGFPVTLLEALACGTPVIASNIGSLPEIITDGQTGLLFEPGNSAALREKITWAESHPDEMAKMGERARQLYEDRFTPDSNYEQLIGIYNRLIDTVRR